MNNLCILGSTGSIGINTLNVIKSSPDRYRVIALSAGKNLDLVLEQINEFHPEYVAVMDHASASLLEKRLNRKNRPEILYGTEGFTEISTLKNIDTVVSAITGAAGLMPTYQAIHAGKNIALANKETMVMAGSLIMAEAEKKGVSVVPIDSEHSAIFQSLRGHSIEDLRRVILTASGGPFRKYSLEEMETITPEQALLHPNWKMGSKVTIDSATLMNKGFEAIEARWLFHLQMEQISILIHPQSIVHSMVEYKDGSIICQMGIPDMRIPISYALSYPRHIENSLERLDFAKQGTLNFEKTDTQKFKCLELAYHAAKIDGSVPAVMNGANEIAVDNFLNGKIRFLDIPVLIEKCIEKHEVFPIDSIDKALEADRWARETTMKLIEGMNA